MEKQTKKIILITLWSLAAGVLLAAAGFFIFSSLQFKTYQNTQYKFSLKYPSQWEKNEQFLGTIVSFVRPKETALDVFKPNVNITVQEVPAEIATLASFSKTINEQMQAVFKNIKVIEDKDVTFAGRKGHQLIIEAPQPEKLKARFVWTIKGQIAYIFAFVAKDFQYQKLSDTVDQMVNSFEFIR